VSAPFRRDGIGSLAAVKIVVSGIAVEDIVARLP
jgi:hypothetical protein